MIQSAIFIRQLVTELWKGSLNHPKMVTKNCQVRGFSYECDVLCGDLGADTLIIPTISV